MSTATLANYLRSINAGDAVVIALGGASPFNSAKLHDHYHRHGLTEMLADSPLGLWPMDAAGLEDLGSGENDMVESGTPSYEVSGGIDGVDGYASVNNDGYWTAPLVLGSRSQIAFEVCYNGLVSNATQNILNSQLDFNDGFALLENSSNVGQFIARNAGGNGNASGTTNLHSAWHNILGRLTGSRVQFWTDGVMEDDQAYSTTISNNANRVRLASRADVAIASVQGSIMRPAIYASLTDAAIIRHAIANKRLSDATLNGDASVAGDRIDLDGTGDYASIGDVDWLDFTNLTFGLRWYTPTVSGTKTLIAKNGASGQFSWAVRQVDDDIQIVTSANGTATSTLTFASVVRTGVNTIVGALDPGTGQTVRINGSERTPTGALAASLNNSTAGLNVGAENGGSNPLTGWVESPFLGDFVATAAELASLEGHLRPSNPLLVPGVGLASGV